MNTKTKGDLAIGQAINYFISSNYEVCLPIGDKREYDFVVEKNVRGRGIGTALLEYIKKYAKDHNIQSIELTSSLPLVDAHRFYEKHGGVFKRKVISFDL